MSERLQAWWKPDTVAEGASADNPRAPLTPPQRRDASPLLALACGWGFRITDLVMGSLLGTLISLGIDQRFMEFIIQLANVTPPLIGPVLVDYYLVNAMRFRPELLDRLPAWNPLALVAFVAGAASASVAPDWLASGLFGLLVSMGVYAGGWLVLRLLGLQFGHARVASRAGRG